MKISENHLYHFTEKKDLASIINKGFIPFFGLEYVPFDNKCSRVEFFPRVCFTDLPINLIEKHQKKYNSYAIAMKKEWAINKGLNPLFYIQDNSKIGQILSQLKDGILEIHSQLRGKEESDLRMEVIFQKLNYLNMELGRYTKPFELDRKVKVKHFNQEEIFEEDRYYDEREWRYVPDITTRMLREAGIYYDRDTPKETLDKFSEKYTLQFELDDIFQIIISKKNDKKFFIKALKERYSLSTNEIEEKVDFKIL